MTASAATVDDQRRAIAATIEFMREDLAKPVRLRDLADFASYSPYHLNRVFRTMIGVPPGEFRAALRFDWAKHLLLNTDMSVTAICFEVGFDSLGTFSSRFREMTGVTPRQFRALPDQVDERQYSRIVVRGEGDTAAMVGGTVDAPGCGPVYLGLFPTVMPRGVPVAGTFLPEPGEFELGPVPYGTYHLLGAAFPPGTDAAAQLLPGDRFLAGRCPLAIEVVTGDEYVERHMTLEPAKPDGFPILVALPALL